MKTLVIYKSVHHKNTEKVTRVISGVLQARMLRPEEVEADVIGDYDLVGFGSGIYFGKHHERLLALVDEMPAQDGKKAFIFSTSGMGKGIGQLSRNTDFDKALREKLEAKGFEVVGDFSCRGYDTVGPLKLIGGVRKGRPNENDLEKAKDFAAGLKNELGPEQ